MTDSTIAGNAAENARAGARVPLWHLQLVRERHSPMYGARKLSQSSDVFRMLSDRFRSAPQEEFVAVFLNAKNAPVGYQVVSVGSLTLSIVHPREAFKAAVLMNAAAVIFAHNHPSGDPTPSAEDRKLTDRLVQCGELLGIRVLDHVVIGDEKYVSFADEGWLTVKGADYV